MIFQHLGEEPYLLMNSAASSPAAQTLGVRVISQWPPGGRCTLYAGYARTLTEYLGAQGVIEYSEVRDAHSHGFPSCWINGVSLQPSDGVIVMPDDVLAALGASGIPAEAELAEALEALIETMPNGGDSS